MWERLQLLWHAVLLMLYMVNYFRWSQKDASTVYKIYTSFVYVTPIIGGYLADRYLGNRRAVIIGAVLMAIGHFLMAFEDMPIFLGALMFLIVGMVFQTEHVGAGGKAIRRQRWPARWGLIRYFTWASISAPFWAARVRLASTKHRWRVSLRLHAGRDRDGRGPRDLPVRPAVHSGIAAGCLDRQVGRGSQGNGCPGRGQCPIAAPDERGSAYRSTSGTCAVSSRQPLVDGARPPLFDRRASVFDCRGDLGGLLLANVPGGMRA